jgi:mRNA interferase MazF
VSTLGIIPRRGEVWWVQLDPTKGSEIAKTRPCIVVTSDLVNARRRTVVVIPISSGPQPAPPLSIAINHKWVDGVAIIDQIRAAAKERFGNRMGEISTQEVAAVEDGICQVLGLD